MYLDASSIVFIGVLSFFIGSGLLAVNLNRDCPKCNHKRCNHTLDGVCTDCKVDEACGCKRIKTKYTHNN